MPAIQASIISTPKVSLYQLLLCILELDNTYVDTPTFSVGLIKIPDIVKVIPE